MTEAPTTGARTAEIILFPSRRASGWPRIEANAAPRADRGLTPPSPPTPDRANIGRAERRRAVPPSAAAPQILPALRPETAASVSGRRMPPPVLPPRVSSVPSGSHDRLQGAMDRLNAALAAQREAVAAWRQSLAELQSSLSDLSGGIHRYRDSLVAVGHGVERLNGEARRLEAWAQSAQTAPGR